MLRRLALPACLALLLLHPLPARAATYWQTDFESGVPAEISAPGAAVEATQGWAALGHPGNTFGPKFLRFSAQGLSDTKLVLRQLPPHTHVSVGFLLAVIDSWDGTELYQVRVNGVLRFNHWFQLATGDSSDYLAPAGGVLSRGTDLGFTNGYYYQHDRAYDLSLDPAFQDVPHTADSLVVTWSLSAISGGAAQQWQGGGDESWAVDNVRVSLRLEGAGVNGPGAGGDVLALALAGAQPATGGTVRAAFTLPHEGGASLELFDAAGRRIERADAAALGAGRHELALGAGRRSPGLYWLRLAQGAGVRTARVVVVR